MSRNLKALGLSMVAALALSGVAASAAQATKHHLTVPSIPGIITAEQHITSSLKFTAGAVEIECNHAVYSGELGFLKNEVTLAATLGECFVDPTGAEIPASIEVNHCALVLTGETDGNGDAKTHIECDIGEEITVYYKIMGEECRIHIPRQTPKGGAHYTSTEDPETEKEVITVELTLKEIKYTETRKAGGVFCPATATQEDGEYVGGMTAEAYKVGGGECFGLFGTERTTPKTYTDQCEAGAQDFELTENATQ